MLQKNSKYRKLHQVYLATTTYAQKTQRQQSKTFDHALLIGNQSSVLRFEEYEALRRILSRKLQRLLRFALIRKPFSMVTAKPREIRMGKGKGAFSHYQTLIVAGQPFAKISWCHRQALALFLAMTRNAAKKSAQRFRF